MTPITAIRSRDSLGTDADRDRDLPYATPIWGEIEDDSWLHAGVPETRREHRGLVFWPSVHTATAGPAACYERATAGRRAPLIEGLPKSRNAASRPTDDATCMSPALTRERDVPTSCSEPA